MNSSSAAESGFDGVADAVAHFLTAEAAVAAGDAGAAWLAGHRACAAAMIGGDATAASFPALLADQMVTDVVAVAEQLAAAGWPGRARAVLALVAEAGREQAALLLARARLERAAGQGETAAGLAERAAMLEPGLAEAHFMLAEHLMARGLVGDAMARLHAVLAIDPGHGAAHRGLGDLWRRQRRLDLATAAYQAALATAADDVAALHGLSAVLRDSGRFAEALPVAERAAALAPGDPWRWVQIGNILTPLGRAAEAAAAYRAAMDRWVYLPAVPMALARQLMQAGRLEEAAAFLGLAAAETGAPTALIAEVADLYDRCGRPADAVPWHRRVVEREDAGERKEANGRAALARALLACGRKADGFAAADPIPLPAGAPADVRLGDALYRFPVLADAARRGVQCAPLLGGFHNTLYRLTGDGLDLVVRLGRFPPARWDLYEVEVRNATAAALAGLAPQVLAADACDGSMVTAFVAGKPMTPDAFRTDPERLRQVADLYRKLHHGPAFFGDYQVFHLIDGLRRTLAASDLRSLPEGIDDLTALGVQVEAVRRLLAATQPPLAPCHNDPAAHNFIGVPGGLVLLDWQCAGRADPHWELGAFTAEADLTQTQTMVVISSYFGSDTGIGIDRTILHRCVSHYYWLLQAVAWGLEGRAEGDWLPSVRHKHRSLREELGSARHKEASARLTALADQ